MARSCYSRIFVQANAPQYCSFQPNRRQRMRRSLTCKRKHNLLVQTGNAGSRRRTVERWQRNKFSGGVVPPICDAQAWSSSQIPTRVERACCSSACAAPASHSRSLGRRTSTPPRSFFRRRKPKDEKRLFICERRLRNPHAPGFSAPKIFSRRRLALSAQPRYGLVAGSCEVREFHSYVVDVGAMIFNMEIVSRHAAA
jgi:hypothetical protein